MHAIRFHSQICSYLEKSKRVKNRTWALLIELLPSRKQGPDRWVRLFCPIFEGSPTSTKTTRKNRIRHLLSTTKPPYSSTREQGQGSVGDPFPKKSIAGDPLLVIAGVTGVPDEKGHPMPNNSTLELDSRLPADWKRWMISWAHAGNGVLLFIRGG
ncbi:hypothetical protein AVEN_230224-1 [Araneus ventricosus]|uniref:Uncharacterized protein n=1 Tax=Araneus ventricosus TaxID=182803 RepID=A0A4Y2DXU9_ARAVE|nr:hypothetical protein AVEN_230224-1 [Araneus ventricosus]